MAISNVSPGLPKTFSVKSLTPYFFSRFPALNIESKDCSRNITVLRIYSFPDSMPQ